MMDEFWQDMSKLPRAGASVFFVIRGTALSGYFTKERGIGFATIERGDFYPVAEVTFWAYVPAYVPEVIYG